MGDIIYTNGKYCVIDMGGKYQVWKKVFLCFYKIMDIGILAENNVSQAKALCNSWGEASKA
jgi:hypothetical protein